jgi:hypothetical protein
MHQPFGGDMLASGDIPGLLRYLRAGGEARPLDEVARLVAGAARLAGFGDLERAAAAVAGHPGADDSLALCNFGCACTERGTGYLAVRPLTRALELAPGAGPALSELAAALEQDRQHARAVTVLEQHEAATGWHHRFQYACNALTGGRLDKAAEGFGRLPGPQDAAWAPAREKVRRMLARAGTARTVTPPGHSDLRGWHYVLAGGVLGSLSPYGFDQAERVSADPDGIPGRGRAEHVGHSRGRSGDAQHADVDDHVRDFQPP